MQVFGVSFDTPEENLAFADKFDFPFTLLSDPTCTMGLAYGACEAAGDAYAKRYTYLVSADGVIERAIDTQDPGAQAAEILAAL